jgi:hypothetical protein
MIVDIFLYKIDGAGFRAFYPDGQGGILAV